jgi:hypothetical protein
MPPSSHSGVWTRNAAVVGTAYVAAFLFFIFAIVGPLDRAGANALVPAVVFAAINVGFGFWVSRWWATALAILIPLITSPIGNESIGRDSAFEFSLFLAVLAALLLASGVAVGRICGRTSATS